MAGPPGEVHAEGVLKGIKSSNDFLSALETEEGEARIEARTQDEVDTDQPLTEALKELTEPASDAQADLFMPLQNRTTLDKALDGHNNLDSALSDLWRLLYYVRAAPKEGCDIEVVPDPMKARKKVQKDTMKWQNWVTQHLARLDLDKKQPASRQSRQTAWMERTEKQRLKVAPSLPEMLQVDTGNILAVWLGGSWQVGMACSIWRCYQAKSGGGQLTSRPLPRGSLNAVRIIRNLFWN